MQRRLISKIPVFDLTELHGKTLAISVASHEYPRDGVRSTVVVGTDEDGISYVLVDRQERINVRPD